MRKLERSLEILFACLFYLLFILLTTTAAAAAAAAPIQAYLQGIAKNVTINGIVSA